MDRTFCFVDVAGFTALTEAHGDTAGADLIARFEDMVRGALGGESRLVAVSGDAVFVVSDEPGTAIDFLQSLLVRAKAEQQFPMLRAGLHHGDAVERRGQFYGTAVNLAARVAAHARGGQVLATAAVAAAASSEGIEVRSIGSVEFKNLKEPLEVFSLHIAQGRSGDAIDPVCRMRVTPEHAAAHLQLAGGAEHWFCSRECLQAFIARGG